MVYVPPIRMAFLLPAAALAVVPVETHADEGETGAEGESPTGVFWRVDKPGGDHIYLLGSLHFGDDSLFPLAPVMISAYQASSTLVFETDLRKAAEPTYTNHMLERARMAEGKTLRDAIGEESFAAFEKAAREVGLDPEVFLSYRAWYCANSLMTVALRQAGVDPGRGIDRVLFAQAERDDKHIVALETPEFQLELFAGLGDAQAEQLLRQATTELTHVETFVAEMLAAYRAGDLTTLQSMINDGFEGMPALKERFFSRRNAAWVRQLRRMAGEPGDVFVVVGSGHLLGKGSIVDLLRQAGLSVTRL